MADIVERARNHAELLRKMEEISEQPGQDRIVNTPTQKLLIVLADEIERLREELATALTVTTQMATEADEAADEIERLRAALDEIRLSCGPISGFVLAECWDIACAALNQTAPTKSDD